MSHEEERSKRQEAGKRRVKERRRRDATVVSRAGEPTRRCRCARSHARAALSAARRAPARPTHNPLSADAILLIEIASRVARRTLAMHIRVPCNPYIEYSICMNSALLDAALATHTRAHDAPAAPRASLPAGR